MVADVFHFYAGAVDKRHGETIPVAGGIDMTFREPLGVVGLIVPWNFPLNISSWKLGPALATGNTIVLKPAELTPLSAMRLAELALEAGIPEGVLNVVVGKGSVVGQRLVEHPDVAKIGFTGSTEVGRGVMEGAAKTIKRVTLELGGKSANVVFADADLEKAAAAAPYAVFDNAGQDCCARSRILVEKSAYDRFAELLIEATRNVKVGDPREEATEMGPLISKTHRETVASFVEATPLFQGDAPTGKGYWFPCTLVEATNDDRIARDEVFGPVAALIPFDDEADAIRIANDTPYGLSGSIWTQQRRPRAQSRASARHRRTEHQLELQRARLDTVRRLQAIGLRPRARHARARRLLGSEERLLLDGGLMGRLDGKVCVITGAGGGMGRDAAELFTQEGAKVCAADVNLDAAKETASHCEEGTAFAQQVDVADEASVAAMMSATKDHFGGIDVLYNNAGISPADDASVLDTTTEAWDRVQAVNTKGVFLCCKHGIPHLLERGSGSVINVASFVAIVGAATSQISYTASKGAVLSMTRELAVQFARQGVRVNALCPGPVETPLLLRIFGDDPAALERRRNHWPTGRLAKAERGGERRAVPRLRRVVVRHRRDVPRRRRSHRRVRHTRMKLCLMIEGQEGVTWPQWVALARAAEDAQLDALFRSDHYRAIGRGDPNGALDAWGTICALAAITSTIKLGTLVTPVTFRKPSVLAKLVTTADHISGGRVELGLGAGWYESEHTAYGFDFMTTTGRLDELDRQLAEITRQWTEADDIWPKPIQQPRPRIIVGGRAKPRTVAAAVKYADEYNTVWPTVDEARERKKRLDDAAEKAGRDPLRFSMMIELKGGADELEEQLRAYADAGVERVMLQHLQHEDVERVAVLGEVAARLR